MGLAPLSLTAVVSFNDTPPTEITYEGQSGTFDMRVVTWGQANGRDYQITAYNEPYLWRLKKITVEYSNVENGVDLDLFVNKIQSRIGDWTIDNPGGTFSFISYSGSVFSAIQLLGEMTGKYVYLDHEEKEISFLEDIPTMEATEGTEVYLAEKSEANTIDTEEIVVYGNLNRPSENNEISISNIGIKSYRDTEIFVDDNAWDVSSEIRVDSYTDRLKRAGEWEEIEYEGLPSIIEVPSVKRRINVYERSFRPVLVAATNSITQDEVVDYGVDETNKVITPDGEEFKTRKSESDVLKVEYEEPTTSILEDADAERLIETLRAKNIKTFPISNSSDAETIAKKAIDAIQVDIMGGYSKQDYDSETVSFGDKPENTIYVVPFRIRSTTGNIRSLFSLSAYVVSAIPMQSVEYTKTEMMSSLGGQMTDIEMKVSEPPTNNMTAPMIAAVYKAFLLRHLKFTWEFSQDADRVKFPYAVDSSGMKYEPDEDIGDNIGESTLVLQNNYLSDIDDAANMAKIMKEIANMDVEEGYLVNSSTVNFSKSSRYSEVYSMGDYKAVQYIRKEGSE
jgi:hypothetical protein